MLKPTSPFVLANFSYCDCICNCDAEANIRFQINCVDRLVFRTPAYIGQNKQSRRRPGHLFSRKDLILKSQKILGTKKNRTEWNLECADLPQANAITYSH